MECPSCSAEIPDEARFCAYCGTPLRRCESCDRLYANDAEFCGVCGTGLTVEIARNDDGSLVDSGPTSILADEDARWRGRADEDLFGFLYRPNYPERRHYLREGDTTLGAGDKNDIVIEQPAVSWNHALLICRDERILIQDSASTNGTYVNDVRLSRPRQLSHGDVVRFGNVEYRVWLKPQMRNTN